MRYTTGNYEACTPPLEIENASVLDEVLLTQTR